MKEENKMTNNNDTELKEIKTYTTEQLIEIAKKVVYNRIPSEIPTTTEWNEKKGIYTIYQIIYK